MEPDEIRKELEETGDQINLLIERSIQQGADIRKLKKELNGLKQAISPEQTEDKRSGEA